MVAKYKGTTLEFDLGKYGYKGYNAVCTYRYNKRIDKYSLEMELKYKDIGGSFRIDRQEIDTQYISGCRKTITDNISRIVEQASLSGFFDEYIKRYEYIYQCFYKGNELLEKESLINADGN